MKQLLPILAFLGGLLAQPPPRAVVNVHVTSPDGPLTGAEVTLDAEERPTGSDGVASFSVPLGSRTLRVAKDGFFPSTSTLVLDHAREWIVKVELQPAEKAEEEITVSATRSGLRLQDATVRVEVLSREEIEEKMLMSPGDIVMMLNEMGGLRVQTTSPSLGAASVRMQGMRGRYTRFLSDGLPLFGQQGAGLGLLQIPPMDLGQVEVIKGAASALYGAGAMAGVVNLLSRRPAAEPVREFLVNRTSLGGTDASSFFGTRLSASWGMTLLAGGHWQDRLDRDGDGWADLAGYSRGVARPRFYWDNGKGRTALVTGGAVHEDRSGGVLPGAVLPATGEPHPEALATRRYDVAASFQTLLDGRHVLTARFSNSALHHRHRFGELRERDHHALALGEVSLRGSSGRHVWVAGAAVERDAFRPRDVPRFAYTYVTPGVFLQDDWNVAPWLSLSASARADFQNRFGAFLSPRLAALFRWAGWTSRLSAGRGFFAPSPLTEETESAALARLSVPVPLTAERSGAAAIDVTRALGPWSLTSTLFASRVRHPVRVIREGVYRIINLPEPTSYRGLEFLATWRKSPWSAVASYTYVRSRELNPSSGVRSDVALTPRHGLGVTAVWEKEAKTRLGAECYYTGRQRLEDDPYRTSSRPYVLFGLMAERRLSPPLRLFLNLENLTNVRQTRWGSLLRPGRGPDGRWTVDAWAPLDGRVINGGLRFSF